MKVHSKNPHLPQKSSGVGPGWLSRGREGKAGDGGCFARGVFRKGGGFREESPSQGWQLPAVRCSGATARAGGCAAPWLVLRSLCFLHHPDFSLTVAYRGHTCVRSDPTRSRACFYNFVQSWISSPALFYCSFLPLLVNGDTTDFHPPEVLKKHKISCSLMAYLPSWSSKQVFLVAKLKSPRKW